MTTARTFLRLVLAGVMANVLVAACVVSSDDGDDDDDTACEPNSYKDCTCTDGTASQRKCNASGSGYAACVCEGSSAGGSGNEGGSGSSAEGGTGNVAGTTSTTSGGENGSEGGAPANTGGAPSETSGGAGGADGGEVVPLECQDPADDCEACYFTCCDEWVACFGDETCLAQFNEVLVCVEGVRATADVRVADLEDCTHQVAESDANDPWSTGLTAETVAMVNCLAGDPSESGWNQEAMWGTNSCNNSCFKQ